MTTNPTSFRVPANLDGKADPDVVEMIGYHDNAIQDLQQAIPSLKAQIDSVKTTSTGSTSSATENIVSETIVQGGVTSFNTMAGIVTYFPALGFLNNQTGNTAYTCQTQDSGATIIFDDASAITLTLNSVVTTPYFFFVTNLGAGTVTLTPTSGSINGDSSLLINYTSIVLFDGKNWWATGVQIVPSSIAKVTHEWLDSYDATTGLFTQSQPAYTDISGTPILPATIAAVAHKFLTSYTSGTGAFTAAQPAFSDISGNLATSQLPTVGLSVTITTAKLTTGGTNGSMVFTGGILTASTPAT